MSNDDRFEHRKAQAKYAKSAKAKATRHNREQARRHKATAVGFSYLVNQNVPPGRAPGTKSAITGEASDD